MGVGTGSVPAVAAPDANQGIARSRRIANRVWWGLCALGLALLVTPVVWILSGVFYRGISGWRWRVIWTPTVGVKGGLANDIVGTLLITFGVAVIAGVIGAGCGIYLAEFGKQGLVRTILRGASDVMSGIPSIVFGYVGYVALVVGLHWQFSLLAAFIVLSLLVVPYIAKSTELALNQVPLAYREGGEALGMAKSYLLRKLVLRSAMPGMLTGLVVAIAISIGETAPLLYTAGSSVSYPTGALVHSPVGYLTYAVYADYDSPFPGQHVLSNDAAMILVVLVVLLIIGSRLIVRATRSSAEPGTLGEQGGSTRALACAEDRERRRGSDRQGRDRDRRPSGQPPSG